MLRRFFLSLSIVVGVILNLLPQTALAAGSITPSGGTSVQNGQTFTITVRASGATFDSLQGTISVSGPVSIVSFSAGGATWLPGKAPANNTQFVGIVSPTSNLTVATIRLKGTKEGSGSVSVSGVRLARSGAEVGNSGGSTKFTITRALVVPGAITVSSATHPDQAIAYEATTIDLSWDKPAGVTGFSYLYDDIADTTPPTTVTSADTTKRYEGAAIGTHYFHIRALNADGWGPTTHFKITIKEPDPKVDETLAKTTLSSVRLADIYTNDVENGTVAGVVFEGTTVAGFAANVTLLPMPPLPAETKLTSEISTDGAWRLQVDAPIPAGFYTVTAQGQKEKVLTPASDKMRIQISVAEGGAIRLITDADKEKPPKNDTIKVLGLTVKKKTLLWTGLALGNVLLLAGVAFGTYYYLRRRLK